MSDDTTCDICGEHGRRKRFRMAPEGWKFAETKDEFVLAACPAHPDPVTAFIGIGPCDVCGETESAVPTGHWRYLLVKDETRDEPRLIFVCGLDCARTMWKDGPVVLMEPQP